ncbi:hypothetical protein, partial [Desulfovirgula thermocuniculi]|uniref:hypothetical protein n=1 Tax=Desulfovirgula thermocuniculi TaxID=348842 RepID=UPI00054CE6EC
MWSRCIVCGKLKKDGELATITLYGRRAEACATCAGEAGLSGPEHFSERPELVKGLAKHWKKGRKERCLARLEALRDGLFPEPEQVREWATLAKTDFESFRARLSGLPFLADKLSILMDACGLNGFDACAVLLGWQKSFDEPVVMYKERIIKAIQFLISHGFPEEMAKGMTTNSLKCFAPLYRRVVEWEEVKRKEKEEAARRREEEEKRRTEKISRLGAILEEIPGWASEATELLFRDLEAKASCRPRTKGEAEVALRASRLLSVLEDPNSTRGDLLKALAAYAGKREKNLPEWATKVAQLGYKVFVGPEVRREFERKAREREAQAKFLGELAAEKEFVKALRHRLDALGVTEPLTSDRYEKFRRMLPERLAELFRLKHRYHLFGWSNSEPPWARETPDEIVLA